MIEVGASEEATDEIEAVVVGGEWSIEGAVGTEAGDEQRDVNAIVDGEVRGSEGTAVPEKGDAQTELEVKAIVDEEV